MAKQPPHSPTPLEARYRLLAKECGKKVPRGWNPAVIADEFRESAEQLERVLVGSGPFHDGHRRLLPDVSAIRAGGRVTDADEITALLAQRPRFRVDRRPSLDFYYLDREISAARALDTSGKPTYQHNPIKPDLLLVNADDQTPILGEVKVRTDKDPEAALVQGLVYASLLAPVAQRERLRLLYPDIFTAGTPPVVDVYVVLHDLPQSRQPLLNSAVALAKEVVVEPDMNRFVRRICFLDAYVRRGKIRFRALAPPATSIPRPKAEDRFIGKASDLQIFKRPTVTKK